MSLLTPSIQVLDKGLNLQTAKILAPPGSVLDSLNYEQVDFQGQKRIDGYSRYDGVMLAAIDDVYYIPTADITTRTVVEADVLYVDGKLFGIVYSTEGDNTLVVVWDRKLLNTFTYTEAKEEVADQQAQYDLLLAVNAFLRGRVGALPGAVSGLHWFNDRLYGISDLAVVQIGGTTTAGPNDTLTNTDANEQRTILRVIQDDNGSILFLSGGPVDSWEANNYTDVEIDRQGGTDVSSIDRFDPTIKISEYPASFFEARNEQQTRDEDGVYTIPTGGWLFKHQGWEVMFRDGNIPYGGFTALNQNKQGVGTQGPTPINGNNGRPLALLQKVDITGVVPQVNGWKTSSTPTSYNLDPLALSSTDTSYIYADAYLEWNGDAGQITTPDIGVASLAERPATSSVPVEV